MKQAEIEILQEKYYRGETSLEEERKLKAEVAKNPGMFPDEQLVFQLYDEEMVVPDGLEESLLAGMKLDKNEGRMVKLRALKYISMAAAIGIVASIFWFTNRSGHSNTLSDEQQFAIMEQALKQVSYGLQPQENQDLLVLFQDDNLEIIAK